MEGNLEITLLMVVTVVAGISAQVIADYLKVPSIVFLLLFGILLGPSGLDFLHPDLLGSGLEVIVSLSVALILFEGGLNLELRELGEVSISLRNLVTVGTLVTFLGGGMAAHWLGEFPWPIAFLYASLVVVTGPTVVSPLLKQISVERRLETLLEGEGVLIDPVGAILAVVVLNIILDGSADPLTVLNSLVLRLGIGGAIGIGGGWLLGLILKQARFLSEDLKNLVVLAGVWGLFGLAQVLRNESGLMTAVAAGVILRAASLPEERLLRRFKGQLSTLAVSVLFILLAADLSLASIAALGWGGPLTVLALMVVVRPINVWISTWNSDLNWRQKAFLSWIAPRGIVAASVASLFSISLSSQGINGGDAIKALVFLTIILTVLLQGLTAQWLASWLKLGSTEATGVIIVGCNPLGRLLGRLLQERGEYVAMIDTNPESCRLAEADHLPVFLSSALDMKVLAEAGLSSVGTFLAMTSNAEVNYVLAQRAQEEFRPPRVLAVYAHSTPKAQGAGAEKPASPAVQHAFSSQLSIKRWSQYLNEEAVKFGEMVLEPEKLPLQTAHLEALVQAEVLMPLLVERQGRWQIPLENEPWEPGDRILYLLHTPRPKPVSEAHSPTAPAVSLAQPLAVPPLPQQVL